MCGIVGAFYFKSPLPYAQVQLEQARDTMAHRGPDDAGLWCAPNIFLGHRRLAILDLSQAAHQPFISENERYILCYNGEIFNYKELANSFLAKQKFKTNSDTEVLLHLLIYHGTDILPKLNGFFAFAFYDTHIQTLLLARDGMGEKPLFYALDDDKILFASELAALLPFMAGRATIQPAALTTYFRLNYLPPDICLMQGVNKLAPGSFLQVGIKAVAKVEFFFSLKQAAGLSPVHFAEATQQVRAKVEQAVARRMLADVPVGIFLSGGIDSAIIAATARKIEPNITAYTVGFKDKNFDESIYAIETAKYLGIRCEVVYLSIEQLAEAAHTLTEKLDEPFGDSSLLNFYLLAQAASKEIRVTLTGDGADELFGGYVKHYAEWRIRNLPTWVTKYATLLKLIPFFPNKKIKYRIHRFLEAMNLSNSERFLSWAATRNTQELQALLTCYQADSTLLAPYLQDLADLNAVLRTDLYLTLEGDMLVKADRGAMFASMEARPPFLDIDLIQYVESLPDRYKVYKGKRKYILRAAFKPDLPPQIFRRPKRGFETPLRQLLRGPLRQSVQNALKACPFFAQQALQHYWNQLDAGTSNRIDWTLWTAYVFARWVKRTGAVCAPLI